MAIRKRYGVPEATTQGNVGDLYVDLNTGKVYRCEDIVTYGDEHSYGTVYTNRGNKNTVYVWKSTGASSYNELEDKPFYEEIKEKTVTGSNMTLLNFPAFAVGDTVNVTVDGVEYSLVAYKDGTIIIGDSSDDLAMQRGELGWQIWRDSTEVHFYSEYEHTVSYSGRTIKTIDPKYLPAPGTEIIVATKNEQYTAAIDLPISITELAEKVRTGCEVVIKYDTEISYIPTTLFFKLSSCMDDYANLLFTSIWATPTSSGVSAKLYVLLVSVDGGNTCEYRSVSLNAN